MTGKEDFHSTHDLYLLTTRILFAPKMERDQHCGRVRRALVRAVRDFRTGAEPQERQSALRRRMETVGFGAARHRWAHEPKRMLRHVYFQRRWTPVCAGNGTKAESPARAWVGPVFAR